MQNLFLNIDFEYFFSNQFGLELFKDFPKILKSHCLVILKPECLLTNKVDKAIDILREYGFEPVYIKIKTLSQQQVFSLWKYGWENASTARILMNYIVMSYSPCAILLLKNHGDILEDPCVFLNSKKGSSFPIESDHTSIRYKLGAVNNFLNYIHVSDSFADMIREMAILFDYNELLSLYKTLQNTATQSSEDYKAIVDPYIKNYTISDPYILFKNYVEDFSNNNKNIRETQIALNKALSYKKIPNELFIDLLYNNLIIWDWNSIVFFSTYIETVGKPI